jgi:hypothetical protein
MDNYYLLGQLFLVPRRSRLDHKARYPYREFIIESNEKNVG